MGASHKVESELMLLRVVGSVPESAFEKRFLRQTCEDDPVSARISQQCTC